MTDEKLRSIAPLARNRKFESISLQQRVREPSVPQLLRPSVDGGRSGFALHIERRTVVAQTSIYRYDGERAAMVRQTKLVLPREPVRRRGAHMRSNDRELLPMERTNNDQHALRQRASPLQRGRAGG